MIHANELREFTKPIVRTVLESRMKQIEDFLLESASKGYFSMVVQVEFTIHETVTKELTSKGYRVIKLDSHNEFCHLSINW